MFSILVVAPLRYSRQATVQHIEKTLPSNVPHQITAKDNLEDCEAMLSGADPVVFSHVVLVLKDVHEIIALTDRILKTLAHSSTTIVIITDLAQKRKIIEQAQERSHKSLESETRVLFVFKPLKPSRFAIIFDPQKGREMSTDRNQDSAQQVAYNQKQVFAELSARLGKKDKRVLLVEDNRVNQMVILKFFSKVGIPVETVMDGVQCTEKVFAKPHGYFSLILVSRTHCPRSSNPTLANTICLPVRSPYAQQRRLPNLQGTAQVGKTHQATTPAHHRAFGKRPRRCLPEVRRRRLQQLPHQARRFQRAQHCANGVHGPDGSSEATCFHE